MVANTAADMFLDIQNIIYRKKQCSVMLKIPENTNGLIILPNDKGSTIYLL